MQPDPEQLQLPPAKHAAVHRSLLAGLLGNVGVRGETHEYTGARNNKFSVFPGSTLFKSKPQWVMAAEIVETTKTYARTIAPVRTEWIESLGAHLVKREYFEPHWQSRTGHVVAFEKVTLYGLVLVPKRIVHYGPIDPTMSRRIFIENGLVDFDIRCDEPFMRHNRALVDDVERMENKTRKRDILADPETIYAFFDQRLPADVYNLPLLEKWRRSAERGNPKLLFLRREDVLKRDPVEITPERFPDVIDVNGIKLQLEYRFDSASHADGITAVLPLFALNQLPSERFEWLVPGVLQNKLLELIRTLPKTLRTQFIPNADFATVAAKQLQFGEGVLLDALAAFLGKHAGTVIARDSFDPKALPPWLKMNFRVEDDAGKIVAESRDLDEIRRELRIEVRQTFQKLPPSAYHRENVNRWDFGDLPAKVEVKKHGLSLSGFPALVEEGKKVAIRTLESSDAATIATRGGVRRLFMSQLAPELRRIVRVLPQIEPLSLNYSMIGKTEDMRADLASAIADRALALGPSLDLRTKDEFVKLAESGWKRLGQASNEVGEAVAQTLESNRTLVQRLSATFAPALMYSANDMRQQLARLVYPGFIAATPFEWLQHLPRYLRGIDMRLTKLLNAGLTRDEHNLAVVRPLMQQYLERQAKHRAAGTIDPALETYGWMLEELRVSLFAQELKTPIPISPKRLEKQWALVKS